MKIDDRLTEVFDLTPADYKDITTKKATVLVADKPDDMIDNDYQNVRDNLYDLLGTGKDALLDMLEVAKQSEDPKSYEVVGSLLKQLSNINNQLLNTHSQKQRLNPTSKKEPASNITTNNSIFVGSTAELSNFLQNQNSEKS
jgi:hypothetical protein